MQSPRLRRHSTPASCPRQRRPHHRLLRSRQSNNPRLLHQWHLPRLRHRWKLSRHPRHSRRWHRRHPWELHRPLSTSHRHLPSICWETSNSSRRLLWMTCKPSLLPRCPPWNPKSTRMFLPPWIQKSGMHFWPNSVRSWSKSKRTRSAAKRRVRLLVPWHSTNEATPPSPEPQVQWRDRPPPERRHRTLHPPPNRPRRKRARRDNARSILEQAKKCRCMAKNAPSRQSRTELPSRFNA
mmetsp:Transcript_11557/g.33220  ORF Transcript_11557/g.33220 Transcript_11557/m.33220 type:complete len:238 (-) Transcript_11557:1071-1784(-)